MFTKKIGSLLLSSVLLLTACGGGGGNGDVSTGGGNGGGSTGGGSPGTHLPGKEKIFDELPHVPVPDTKPLTPIAPPDTPVPDTKPLVPIVGISPWQPLLPPSNGNPINQFNFLVFSDVHVSYDPNADRMQLYPSSYTSAGNDLDFLRFRTFLGKISDYFPRNSQAFALVVGDTSAHSSTTYRDDNLIGALSDFKKELGDKLDFSLLHIPGNNDSMEGHYGPPNESNYSYIPVKAGWTGANGKSSPYLSNAMECGPRATFPCISAETKKGYFAVYLQHELKLISLDTVMFTGQAEGNYTYDDANDQFGWFERQMQASKEANENVILAMHIAPSPGSWGVEFNHPTDPQQDIDDTVNRFENILADRPGVVIGMFTGHSHFDNTYTYDIEISGKKPYQYIPRLNVIGLSTSHGNAAGFKEVAMAKDENNKWAIQNFSTYVFQPSDAEESDVNLKLAKLYNFNSTYCPIKSGQPNITLAKCMYPKEKNVPSLDDFETGKNPNCFKYDNSKCSKENEPLPPAENG